MKTLSHEEQLRAYYRALYAVWGCQHWWPGRTPFEVIVGAYLTQNTAWKNVEVALRRLRSAGRLTLKGIRQVRLSELETLIRSAGYFRQKAARIKTFVAFIDRRYGGSLNRMFKQPTAKLRQELLALNGVGPETADSILLYAGQHPVFVVDAYTRRIFERHGLVAAKAGYEQIRELFERALRTIPAENLHREKPRPDVRTLRNPLDTVHAPSPMSLAKRSPPAQRYNDMHGLIVGVGKHYCLKAEPLCQQCPLREFLPR